jgi:oxepin-CoA hydrolase / 3-oxo-5,6-dehydrosuberyl-CoA semialdehyde dehydrogenase
MNPPEPAMPVVPFNVNDANLRRDFLGVTQFEALAALSAVTTPVWGAMSAQQMVEHLLWAVEMSTGTLDASCLVPEMLRQRARGFLAGDMHTPHHFGHPLLSGGLPALRFDSVALAIDALRAETDRFLALWRDTSDTAFVHPVFGTLAMDDWSRSHFKHSFHHLLQFGLIEEAV